MVSINLRLSASIQKAVGVFLTAAVLSVSCQFASAVDYPVSSAADISSILPSLNPGDSLVMQNGTWTNQQINFSAIGSSNFPITLRAETPGEVILNGNSSLNITGDWLVADGLRFEGGALGANDHVVEFRGNRGEATNSRLTNSTIVDYNPSNIDTRYFWVSLYGENNRVDHNHFEGQNHSGVTVTVWRNSNTPDFHRIDSNQFVDRPEGNGNGFEAIRIGTSDRSLSDSFTTVENNLFDNVDGEIEIISNKSGNNTLRYNTFRESAGTLTLRHGDNNTVEGNFFLGQGKDRSGGVRVIGEGQTITNNYFSGLDGRAGGAISISAAVPNSALNEYFQVKDAVIAHNTIVDVNDAAIEFDDGLGSNDRTLLAEDVTIANNLIRSNGGDLFQGNEGSGWTFEGNIAYGSPVGVVRGNPGVTEVDPQLALGPDGLWRPAAGSPAINGGSGNYSGLISDDVDGQPRVGLFDIGADEFSSASIVRQPLVVGDVGPDWTDDGGGGGGGNPGGGGGGNVPGGLAIQAEGYTSILDPDGDGRVWQEESNSDALGGVSVRAPDHNRINRPGDTHETLLTYDVEFSEEGTYTAYYRARGFDGSSDSLYVPDDFGTDPDDNETLSNNGVYRWEVGGTFEITSPSVDVPLEFRIGSREGLADFDAFVFHVDSNLTPSQLDELFSLDFSVDFNADGLVDCADVDALVAAIADGSNTVDFDLTGDGLVDGDDLSTWLADAGEINLGSGAAYLSGDANLDGVVDASDFNVWNANKFTQHASWCSGDFTADGFVDGSDFNAWNSNKFSSSLDVAAVPEPAGFYGLLLAGLLIFPRKRTKISRSRK